MTYWNEIKDSHIQFWNTEKYPSYYKIRNEINEHGYRGDLLQSSKVLYLGTCDVMTNIPEDWLRWSKQLHFKLFPEEPFIALGTVACGLPTMVRRLYSFIQNFAAPEHVYMTVPRFDGYEFVNKSGNCYNASSRVGSANFCKKAGFVNDEEHEIWLMQLAANKKLNNSENTKYMLEERFAFLETICLAHKIKLHWTFNPSDAAITILKRNLPALENISNFMKNSFVGVPEVKDHMFDRSIGPDTHTEICNKFLAPEAWDYEKLCQKANSNFEWLTDKYGTDLIKMEE